MLNTFLGDDNENVLMAVYKQLLRLDDTSVKRVAISDNFYIDRVFSRTARKAIYVQRMGGPMIVLFGSPIICKNNSFIESKDGELILNAVAGAKEVTVMRKHPRRDKLIGPLKSSFELGDIVATFCNDVAVEKGNQQKKGLGVSYSEIIPFLQGMCEKGAIDTRFIAGPSYNIGVKNQDKTK
jgi:hypothetical protein